MTVFVNLEAIKKAIDEAVLFTHTAVERNVDDPQVISMLMRDANDGNTQLRVDLRVEKVYTSEYDGAETIETQIESRDVLINATNQIIEIIGRLHEMTHGVD